ncbi:MAG: hypothetical protein ABIK09_16050 [Pseudomonadota bacterium]
MIRRIAFLPLILVFTACDLGNPSGIEESCVSGVWRTCVTESLRWGRRFCGPIGWESLCREPVCTPDDTNPCWSACGYASERLCAEDGFWNDCGPTEVCNGLDDDCDGQTDEGLSRECWCACNLGESRCVNGQWLPCDDGTGEECRPPWECGDPAEGGSEFEGQQVEVPKLSSGHQGPGSYGNQQTYFRRHRFH